MYESIRILQFPSSFEAVLTFAIDKKLLRLN